MQNFVFENPTKIIFGKGSIAKIGAEVSDADEILGTIEPGKLADCLVLDKDPLADIRNLRTAQVIIQGGKIVKR